MKETPAQRRIGGWGFVGEDFQPSQQLMNWLEERIGPPGPPITDEEIKPPGIPAQKLPEFGADVSFDALDRLSHARGQGVIDVIRVRSGLVPALPDGVCRPRSADEVESVIRRCSSEGIRVIPWGGGTSVTGGVNVLKSDSPTLSLDLGRLSGMYDLDAISGLATFGPGTTGPGVESVLAEHDLTLGHYPQSWELATVGGWVAARSTGQESLGYGRIEDMVAGLDIIAPAGRIHVPDLPASAAGPDLRHLIMGSEGRLGVITSTTLRVRPRPQQTAVEAALMPSLEDGIDAARQLTTSSIPLAMLRLSDAPETQVAMAVGLAASSAAPLLRGYLRLRGIGSSSCLMLIGAAGDPVDVRATLSQASNVLRSFRGVVLGRKPGKHWLRDRFRHPYLREALLDRGYATDTLETAVPWSRVIATREAVAHSIATAIEEHGERIAVLCHASHPYHDGVSLYFTFFFASNHNGESTIARWAQIKRAANDALIRAKATLSHHHGVGQWHAPWLHQEIGPLGQEILRSAAKCMDPNGILNPNVLFDETDHLED